MSGLVYGVGINDANYNIEKDLVLISELTGKKIRKKIWACPFYKAWARMLERCYSEKFHKTRNTYKGCAVCEDWKKFSNFKKWMEQQDWTGKQLDKDLLIPGNKIYSPETCVFVDKAINLFMTDCKASRGKFPIGVAFVTRDKVFQASCSNPLAKKKDYLGTFDCPIKAHLAWRKRKHEIACMLADMQKDERIASALRKRYLPMPEQTKQESAGHEQ